MHEIELDAGSLEVRPMTRADVAQALALSDEAGWNQIAEDWQRLVSLFPEHCLVGCIRGGVVATATLACYGQAIGWVGMILVASDRRGRGLGTRMLEAICQHGRARGLETLGLDATDLGRPLYLKHGFVTRQRIDRWIGTADAAAESRGASDSSARPPEPDDWETMLARDRVATGVDRGALLRRLADEPDAAAVVHREGKGFALARAGREASHVGPIVAGDVDAAASLLRALARDRAQRSPGSRLILDAPRDPRFTDVLGSLGFSPQRTLVRMTRPESAAVTLAGPSVFAFAGLELG